MDGWSEGGRKGGRVGREGEWEGGIEEGEGWMGRRDGE